MKKILAPLLLGLVLAVSPANGAEKKQTIAEHLQNVSVTIRSESGYSAGEGSGVIFTRKDSNGNLVNFVWTAAHVVDNMRLTKRVLVDGTYKTIVHFRDPVITKEIRQNGRTVGRLQMDAEVLKYSESEDGQDLALLRVRKLNFVTDSVVFYLDKEIPPLGTDLLHVGSLLGQFGANSMTSGIMSQHGRILKDLNKHIFDQTTCTAFPGSSGGGVFLKHGVGGDTRPRYVGMLVRGAGEGFNLIVPIRRMVKYCEEHKIMWALDRRVPMPQEEELKKMSIENAPSEKKEESEGRKRKKNQTKKMFPFMLRVTYPDLLIIKEKINE